MFHFRLATLALLDNTRHGFVSGLCWLIVLIGTNDVSINHLKRLTFDPWMLIELSVATMIGSLIDIDHFVEARSLALQVKYPQF